MRRRIRSRRATRVLRVGEWLAVIRMLTVTGANAVVLARTHGPIHSEVADVDRAEVAIVPGALVQADGAGSRATDQRGWAELLGTPRPRRAATCGPALTG